MKQLVATLRGNVAPGDVSRDGRFLPYLSDHGVNGQLLPGRALFVRDLENGTSRVIVAPTGQDAAPGDLWCVCALSHDTDRVAYTWWSEAGGEWRPELRVVSVVAGAPAAAPVTLLAVDSDTWIEPYDWTPDGRGIVVLLVRRSIGTSEIAFLSAEEGSVRLLRSLPTARLWGRLSLSPDGSKLAYEYREESSGGRDIAVIEIATGREQQAVAHAGDDALVGWAPDGSLLFTSDRRGVRNLWRARIGEEPGGLELLDPMAGEASALGVTSDGAMYVGVSYPAATSLRVDSLHTAGSADWLVPMYAEEGSIAWDTRPSWSPDGRQIAWSTSRTGTWSDVAVSIRSLDNGTRREIRLPLDGLVRSLTPGGGEENVVWSPDSRGFALTGRGRDGAIAVFFADLSTGALSRIEGALQFRGWSADGTRYFFDRPTPDAPDSISVLERDLSSGLERELFRGPGGGSQRLVIAQDGGTVYFRRPHTAGAQRSLVARSIASGAETVLISDRPLGALGRSPGGGYITANRNDDLLVIRADGAGHLYLRNTQILGWAAGDRAFLGRTGEVQGRPNRTTLEWVDAETGARRRVEVDAGSDRVLGVALSPAGGHVAYIRQEPSPARPMELWRFDYGVSEDTSATDPGSTTASVSITTTAPAPLEPGFAGYNVALMTEPIRYSDPRLAAAATPLGPGWLRFPAGTRAAAYHWRTGRSRQEWVDRFEGSPFHAVLADALEMLEAKGGERIEDAHVLAAALGARGLIVVVNTFTDSPASAGELAAYAKERGIAVLVWQLGNEPTLFPAFFAGATDYAVKMRPYADAIRAADPGARISLALNIVGREPLGWDDELASFPDRYWDVLTYHHYPRLRGSVEDLTAALNGVLEHETDAYVRRRVEPLFGAMPLIISEVAPGTGDGRRDVGMSGTLYGGIWAAEYAMRLSALPQVLHVGMHQLLGPAGVRLSVDHHGAFLAAFRSGRPLDPDTLDYHLGIGAQGAVYGLAADVLRSADRVYSTSLEGGGSVPLFGPGEHAPALRAQAYRTGGTTTLLVTNRGDRGERVMIRLDGQLPRVLQITSLTAPSVDAVEVHTLRSAGPPDVGGGILIPPRSLNRIVWQ